MLDEGLYLEDASVDFIFEDGQIDAAPVGEGKGLWVVEEILHLTAN